jgi:hypothetical protein
MTTAEVKDHVTRVEVRDNDHGHRCEWEAICLCGWQVSFGSPKPKRKAYRMGRLWADYHEELNDE